MNEFLEAYFQIDKDQCESITIEDLEQYKKDNNYKDSFVEKWINLFDHDNSGTITLEEFCDTLGLVLKEARMMRQEFLQEKSGIPLDANRSLPDDVMIIYSSMTKDGECDVVDIETDANKKGGSAADILATIKRELDEQKGRNWHVVRAMGEYWAYTTALEGQCFYYKRGRYLYLVWQTNH